MGTLTQLVSRDRLVVAIGTVLLAGGLLGLWFPVLLGNHDQYGIQVRCGNGYSGELLQAATDEQRAAREWAPDGAPTVSYVGRCQNALAHRRAWAIPAAALGVLILTGEQMTRARRRVTAPSSRSSTGTWREAPDDFWHEAAHLDRQGRPHRERPTGTTL